MTFQLCADLVGCRLSVASADQLLDLGVETFHRVSGPGALRRGRRGHWDGSRLFIITGRAE